MPSVWRWYNSLANLVHIVVPTITGFIVAKSHRLMFLTALILHILALSACLFIYTLEPGTRQAICRRLGASGVSLLQEFRDIIHTVRDRSILVFLIIYSFEALYLSMRYLGLYVLNYLRIPLEIFGLAVSVGNALGLAAPLFSSAVVKRLSYRRTIALGQGLLSIKVISYVFASVPWQILIIEVLRALTTMYYPARDSYLMALTPPEIRGKVLSIQNIAFQLATIPAPAVGAVMWGTLGPKYIFLFDASIAVVLAALTRLLKRNTGETHEN